MTKELNWKEQMHWELYKQYLKTPNETYVVNYNVDGEVYTKTVYTYKKVNEAYAEALIATDQFINNLAADAREELESTGWKDNIESYQESYTNHRNSECYHAVYRALACKPLNH